jgi:2,7-dihydroxy-5-methyl-1-naphthoate 7-O-methyltransferase
MPRPDPPDIWTLSDLCTPWCVHVVATLRIADHLAAGITQIDDLAARRAPTPIRCTAC